MADYSNEQGLRRLVALSPEEEAHSRAVELSDGNIRELQREIARNPMQRAMLQGELDKLTAARGGAPAPEVPDLPAVPSTPRDAPSAIPAPAQPINSMAALKARYPDLADLDDDSAVDAVQQAFYPGMPREAIAARLGVKTPSGPVPKSSTLRRLVGDTAVSLVKGAVGVPEAAVGLADLATGGQVGKFLENQGGTIGFRPKEVQAALDEMYSPEQRAANKAVQDAHGIKDVTLTALQNPSVVAHAALQSLPAMGAGGVVGRGALALAPRLGAATAAGIGEGVTTAGQQAEQIREETPDGLLTGQQAALAAGSGLATGAIGVGAGRLAQRLGLENAETLLVGGKASPVQKRSIVRRVIGGAATEGLLEELPQSVQEQVAQNMALGKPLDEGVDHAAVLGVLTGSAMGVGAQAFHGGHAEAVLGAGSDVSPGDAIRADAPPVVGALSAAANVAVEGQAKAADRAPPAPEPLDEHQATELLQRANERFAELNAKEKGAKAVPAKDGQEAVDAVAPQFLTPDEKEERDFLRQHGGDVEQLRTIYPVDPPAPPAPTPAVDPVPGPDATSAGEPADKEAEIKAPAAEAAQAAADEPSPAPAPAPRPRSDAAAVAQREADRPPEPVGEPQPGDILTKTGGAFRNIMAASRALKEAGSDTHELVRVRAGLVVRPKATTAAAPSSIPAPGAGSPSATVGAAPITVQPAGTRGTTIDDLAHAAATSPTNDLPEPTQAQKEAGNYQKGHASIAGLDLSIENPAGSTRSGVDKDGTAWSNTLQHHYGYIRGTLGNDGDHVDAFVKPGTAADHDGTVYVVDQFHDNGAGAFDEHKALIGFGSEQEARDAYQANYAEDWTGGKSITAMPMADFKAWVRDGAKSAPLAAQEQQAPEGRGDEQDAPQPAAHAAPAAETVGAPVEAEGAPAPAGRGAADAVPAARPGAVEGAGVEPAPGAGSKKAIDRAAEGRRLREEAEQAERAARKAKAMQRGKKPAPAPQPEIDALPFKRAEPAAPADAARHAEVEHLAQHIASRWANGPKVVVARSMNDPAIPAAARAQDAQQQSQGAEGDVRGLFHGGTVYLIADKLQGMLPIVDTLMHEALGHYGLRGVFGSQLGTILDRMSVLQAGKVRTKAREYGLDFEKQSDRRKAAEEVLAEMAEKTPGLGWVRKAVAVVRSWLREHVPGFADMKLTDDEIIRSYILPARAFVQQGRPAFADTQPAVRVADPAPGAAFDRSDEPAFSRSVGDALAAGVNDVKDMKLPAGYLVGDLFDKSGKLGWWHKTIGTMHGLAERSPEFRRVYDATQNFLNDVSAYATEAADLAPRLLPKLENWRDIMKSPISAEDTKAIAAPIFEGTLTWARDAHGKPVKQADLQAAAESMPAADKAQEMLARGLISAPVLKMWQGLPQEQFESNIVGRYERQVLKAGVVFTDAELADLFHLTPEQAALYREFRAATDKSLTSMAVSDMLRFGGEDVAAVRQQALDAPTVDAAALLLRDHLFAAAAANPARADVLNDAGNQMVEKAERANDLMKRGYAPLSRFGQYTLDVVNPDGERVYFGMFESSAARSKMARQMAREFPDATIQSGTVSQQAYKLFAGVSPETLELFGSMLGLEATGDAAADRAFQEFLKLTKTTRSAMKRLIERKGIAGFSEDAGRVLAGFVYSNARQTASNLHMGEMSQAANDIPQQQGQLKDMAVKLVDYVKNPQEEAQALRGLMFAQYLGGSVASAIVNASQPLAVTFPYLSQFGGAKQAGAMMAGAVRDAARGVTGDAALEKALKQAEVDGVVAPQEVHQLMAQAGGKGALRSGDGTRAGDAAATASNALSKLGLAWGKVFSVAEQFNRRVTFIAAYRTAVAQGMPDPAAFATKAVGDTQFTYNKGNRPQWARGAVGATLFTFKQYAINYTELLHQMWTHGGPEGKKAALLALGVLFLMSGADGLPFSADVEDVIDGLLQHMGYNFQTKAAKQAFFAGILGDDGARIALKGLSGLPGVPIDLSGRMGMGNLVPGTGLLTKKADHTQDVQELLGPAGDMAKRAFNAAGSAVTGDVAGGARSLAPTAARNLVQAIDMLQTGMYRDQGGRKVIDTDGTDALMKAIGFQPNNVARIQEATRQVQATVDQTRLRQTEVQGQMAQAMFERDAEKVQDARNAVTRWNEDNPDTRIKLNMPAVLRRVRQMREDKATRLAKAAPAGIRAQVRAQLAETQP